PQGDAKGSKAVGRFGETLERGQLLGPGSRAHGKRRIIRERPYFETGGAGVARSRNSTFIGSRTVTIPKQGSCSPWAFQRGGKEPESGTAAEAGAPATGIS